MRFRATRAVTCLSLVLAGLSTPMSNIAAAETVSTVRAAQESWEVQWVRDIANYDWRSIVRAGAWQALLSSNQTAAVAHFLDEGYAFAVKLSEENSALHRDFATRVLETYLAEVSPTVHAAADRVLKIGSEAELAWFAETGFAEAHAQDSRVREQQGEHAAALVAADRSFIRTLSERDPGKQVRVSAAYAVRAGATDSDLVEFFTTGWALGARLDREAYQRDLADANTVWLATVTKLVVDAKAAEKAAKEAAAEVAEQAKAAAIRAWQEVGTQTTPATTKWTEAVEFSARQVDTWAKVVAAASSASGPNWEAVLPMAVAGEQAWADARASAAQQAQYWTALLAETKAAESRINGNRPS